MRRSRSIWIALGPLLLGAGLLATRQWFAAPVAATAAEHPADRSTALPVPPTPPKLAANAHYELDPATTTIRVTIAEPQGPVALLAAQPKGGLTLNEQGAPESIELEIDASQLRTDRDPPPDENLWRSLGISGSDRVKFVGKVRSLHTYPGGISQVLWQGTWTVGTRTWPHDLELWLGWIQPGRVRLQGNGTALASDFGGARRYDFSLLDEQPWITVGLDLGFRLARAR
jgi:hypothetical protein